MFLDSSNVLIYNTLKHIETYLNKSVKLNTLQNKLKFNLIHRTILLLVTSGMGFFQFFEMTFQHYVGCQLNTFARLQLLAPSTISIKSSNPKMRNTTTAV